MAKQQDPLRKLYDVVSAPDVQLYTKDYDSFKAKYSSDQEIDNLFNTISAPDIQLYTKDLNSFKSQYFPSLGKQTEVSAQGSGDTSQTSVGPTPNIQNSENVLSQLSAPSSELSLPENIAPQIAQANQIASEYGQEGETFEIEPIEGSEFVQGEIDPLTNRLRSPYRVDLATGEQSTVIPTVDTGAVTREQALAQNQRIAQEEAMQDKGFWSDTYNSLQSGLTDFNANLSSIPEYLYRIGAVPQNLIADAIENNMGEGTADWLRARYENVENGVYNPLRILGDYSKSQQDLSGEYSQQVTQFENDILGSITDGNLTDAGRQIFNSIVQSTPAIVGMVATSGAGSAAGLSNIGRTTLNALPFAAGAYQDIESNESMPENLKLVASGMKGLSEVVFEQEFGTLALIESIGRKAIGQQGVKNAVEGYMSKLLNSNGIPASAFKGAISEGSTELSNNIITKYSGENPDQDLWEGVADAMIVGSVMDSGISGLNSISGRIKNPEIREEVSEAERQITAMRADLQNLSMPQAEVLQQAIEAKAQQINSAIARDEASSPVLTQGQQAQMDNISRRAEELQSVLEAEQVSEETTTAIQEEIDTLNQEREMLLDNAFSQGEVDQFVQSFQENNPNTTVDVFEDLPDNVVRTFNRVEENIPTDVVAINEASDWMYNKYQELTNMKSNPDRALTIPQIEGIQEQLSQDIELLENYRYEQTGERSEVPTQLEAEVDNVAGQTTEGANQEGGQVNETQQPNLESGEVSLEGSQVAPLGETVEPAQEVVNEVITPIVETSPATGPQNQNVDAQPEQVDGVTDVEQITEPIPQSETDGIQNQETVQENEQAPVRAEEVQEATTDTEDAAIRPIRESYERLTEGMTPEQIDADPDLVRMRDRISPPEQVESAEPEVTADTGSSQDAEQVPEPSLTRDAKGKVKPLTEIAKSAKARKARMDELRERIEKNKSSLSNLGITPNNRKKAEQWRDITDYAILSLIEGTVNTSRQLADALGLPHSKRLIQAFSEAKNDLFNNREVYGDIGITAAKNAENARRRAEYGFDERITPVSVSFNEVQEEADRMIREGYDVNDLIDRAIANEPLNATEVTILTRYAQEVEMNIVKANEAIESNPNTNVTTNRDNIDRRNKAIDDMYRVIGALEASGTVAARALNIRKALLARDMSLGGMLSEYRAAVGNRNLTSDEIQGINERYTRIVDIKQNLERRNSELEVENARLDAELELARQRYEAELDYRKRKDRSKTKTEQIKDIKKRRETAKVNLSKALGEVFSGNLGLAMDPKQQAEQQVKSDASIAKALRELVRTYIDEAITRAGKVDFDWVIDRIHADVKESVPTATREQVMNMIDSSNPDERPTKTQLQREVARFRNELGLLNKIRNLEKGGVFTSKKRKAINDERLIYLRNRLNELRKRNNDTEVKGKTDEQKAIDSLKKRIAETRRKINERDFSPERKQLVLNDPEVKRLQKELNKEQFRFKVEVRKEEYRNRNMFFKISGTLREIVAVPRTLMATGDLSAPLRQTAFVFASRPLQIIPAVGRMFQFYGSKKAYDDYFDAFKETPDYDLMVKAGVSLTDVAPNIGAAAREEQFMSSFVANMEKFIPGIGGGEVEYNGKKYKVPGLQIHGRAERGFTGYINKVRIDLFTHGAELLMRDGKFPDAYMSDYKKLATYVNAVTGRGPMPEQWSGIMADLSSVFFAPRLMTSRLWLIAGGPLYTGNKVTRQMYLRDLTTFIAFGSLAMAAASLAGAEVIGDDEDETLFGEGAADSWTNSDFGNIVVGDTRYDVWGGFGQYVRFFSRLAFGQKTATTGRVTKFNTDEWGSETYADLALRFGRSKLSPTASLISSAMVGKNYMGEPFSLQQELLNMASPLVWQDTYEAWTDQNEGVKSMYTTFLPSFFGMGVQTWEANSFIKKGVDDKIGDMLNEKKVATRIKDVTNIRFYDPEKGEDRQPTAKELEKFSDTWAEYVKSDLEENYDKYKKMSSDAFDTRFTSIKSAATAFAKKQISGVSTYDLVIESNDIQYRLTPEQVRERLKMNERFIKENRSDFKDLERDYIQSGMEPDKAKIEAEKKMESAARRYSRGQILEAVESGRMQLQEK